MDKVEKPGSSKLMQTNQKIKKSYALKSQHVHVALFETFNFCLHVMYENYYMAFKPTCWFTAAAALAAAGCAKDWSYVGGGPWAAAAAAYSCA